MSLDNTLSALYSQLDLGTTPPEERLFAVVCAKARLGVIQREIVAELMLKIISHAEQIWALELEPNGIEMSVRGWIDAEGQSHLDPRMNPKRAVPEEGARYWQRLDQLASYLSVDDVELPPFIPGTRAHTVLLPNPS